MSEIIAAGKTRLHLSSGSSRSSYFLVLVAITALGASVPLWVNGAPFALILASDAVIAGIVALSLDLLMGNTGLLSFGHAAWYGFGAYVTGLASKLLTSEILVVLPLAICAAMLFAAIVGFVLVRQVGTTFAILTLALGQIMFALIYVMSGVTGGEDGLQGIPIPTAFGIPLIRPEVWYWLLYATLCVALAAAFHVRRSPLGKAWLAIRENTERARFIGMNVVYLKLLSYVVSAALASLAGGLFVLFNGAASPDLLSWFESGKILMYVVLGGVGTIIGPVIGAAVFTLAEHYVSSVTSAWLIYFGGFFVLIVIVAPGGLFGALSSIWSRVGTRSREVTR
jgi:branched-chain amino acid transport system permease protein